MSARAKMRHRCTIQRNQATGPDDWGQEGDPAWTDHLTDVPCHAWFTAGREMAGTVNAVIEDLRMIVPLGTDVTEADRVATITDRQGTELEAFSFPARIESVGRRRDHLVLFLEAS